MLAAGFKRQRNGNGARVFFDFAVCIIVCRNFAEAAQQLAVQINFRRAPMPQAQRDRFAGKLFVDRDMQAKPSRAVPSGAGQIRRIQMRAV